MLIISVINNNVNSVKVIKSSNLELCFKVNNKFLTQHILRIVKILTLSTLFDFVYFIDANCIDRLALEQKNKNSHRFTVIYTMRSLFSSFLLNVVINAKLNKFPSFSNIFLGANWVERELSEFFGLEFINHKDLRRLLLDYGFRGYPFRKDFPLTGFNELSFHTESQTVTYDELALQQEFRKFQTENVWRGFN